MTNYRTVGHALERRKLENIVQAVADGGFVAIDTGCRNCTRYEGIEQRVLVGHIFTSVSCLRK